MATLTAQLHAPTELVAQQWIRTIPGLTADGVAGQLPAEVNEQGQPAWPNGFIIVPLAAGGTPHDTIPLRRPLCQIECWATIPNSDKLPWAMANQLAEQIIRGTYDRVSFGRPLFLAFGTVSYPNARVLSARVMTEPHRIFSDIGDYAGYSFDLALQYVSAGEEVP